jgi:hypothetical protein
LASHDLSVQTDGHRQELSARHAFNPTVMRSNFSNNTLQVANFSDGYSKAAKVMLVDTYNCLLQAVYLL